jgi:hypothetical protein
MSETKVERVGNGTQVEGFGQDCILYITYEIGESHNVSDFSSLEDLFKPDWQGSLPCFEFAMNVHCCRSHPLPRRLWGALSTV